MWYKRTIPLLIVFVIGILAFAQNFIPHPLSSSFLKELTSWTIIIGGFALFLGAYSLLHMHVTRIRRQQPGWALVPVALRLYPRALLGDDLLHPGVFHGQCRLSHFQGA